MARIAVIAHYADSLINFRGELIKNMVNRGHKVKAYAPEKDYKKELNNLGADYEQIFLQRTSMNPLADLRSLFHLYFKLRKYSPDVIFSYAIKPVIYGGIAARFNKVENIYSLIPGVGSVFIDYNSSSLVFKIINYLYKIGLKDNKTIFFQNPDDRALFKKLGIINSNHRTIIVNGSGVDTKYYYYTEQIKKPISFLFMGRLIEDKGIKEYIEAAKIIKDKYPEVKFKVLGPFDTNPSALDENYINKYQNGRVINYLGVKEDVRSFIANTSVFVLPSYREGTPRSVLEAMSMGRPIITTKAPGCKETVENGKNGFLVPVKDSKKLAGSMEYFIKNPEMIVSMGKKSRKIAENKYAVEKVNQVMLEEMGL